MPQLLTDPAHWHLRAQQAHQLAQRLKDPLERAAKLEMADKYDRLAARATEWMNKTTKLGAISKRRSDSFHGVPPTAGASSTGTATQINERGS